MNAPARDRLVVTRTVEAPPAAVFALLVDPGRHVALDGSGTVRGAVGGGPISAVGQRFRMAMNRPARGDYETDNVVTELEPDTAVGWATTYPDDEPLGFTWTFHLAPQGTGRTLVTHVYDWADVTDPELRARFPQVSAEDMAGTLANLDAALR